jgi:uncharacterized Fe-S cluster-containing protein
MSILILHERGKKYLVFSILDVYEDAADVQDSPEEICCRECAQVRSAKLMSSQHMEALIAVLNVTCLIISESL